MEFSGGRVTWQKGLLYLKKEFREPITAWFPREMTFEERALKFHADDNRWHVSIATQIWVVLLIKPNKFSTNHKQYPYLDSDASSVWNFCSRSSNVLSRGWLRREMSAGCFVRLDNQKLTVVVALFLFVLIMLAKWRFIQIFHFNYFCGWCNLLQHPG